MGGCPSGQRELTVNQPATPTVVRIRPRPLLILEVEVSLSKEILDCLYYERGLSVAQIAQQLECSTNKIVYWMDKYGLKRRDISSAVYLRQNPNGDPFNIQIPRSDEEWGLFHLALGLYIGEGKKRDREQVALSNSDPRVIRVFLRFLREICGVEENRIWAWINIFDDTDLPATEKFWLQVTNLLPEQFHKSIIRPSRGGTYRKTSEYGTLSVGVSSTRLHEIVKQWCNQYLSRFG
jgi:hypothetical protein